MVDSRQPASEISRSPTASRNSGKLPLVVGITGHRDLLESDRIHYEMAVRDFLNGLQKSYPNTPIQIISSLAEGADRIAAQVARDAGCELVVSLPFSPEEYATDFPDTVSEFQELLDTVEASNRIVMPLAANNTRENIRLNGPNRDRQYAQVAAYLTSQSHIILALWDGDTRIKVGGTAEVVEFMLNGVPGEYGGERSLLDPADSGPVFHILARRARKPDAFQSLGMGNWIYPEDRDQQAYELIFQHMESFNADPARRHSMNIARSRSYLVPDDIELEKPEQHILDVYACADSMAIHYQNIARRTLVMILVLAGAMALAFEIYAHLLVEPYVLALYPIFFLTITVLYFWHRNVGAHGKHLDYRALAEGLRVQLFWRLVGLPDSVAFNYLRKQNDELEWIREGLRSTTLIPPRSNRESLDLVHEYWIKDQENYFRRCAHRQHERVQQLERYSNALYGTGLIVSLATIGLWNYLEHAHGLHHFLIVVMGFTPVVAALWINYGEKIGLHAQSKQYARFATIFTRARRILDGILASQDRRQSNDEIKHLLRELGKESLIENGDWVVLRRERPIEIPKG